MDRATLSSADRGQRISIDAEFTTARTRIRDGSIGIFRLTLDGRTDVQLIGSSDTLPSPSEFRTGERVRVSDATVYNLEMEESDLITSYRELLSDIIAADDSFLLCTDRTSIAPLRYVDRTNC